MAQSRSGRRVPAVLGACVAVALAGMGSARADVFESSPTLPLLGVPYTIPGGNCFPTAGFCVAGGAFTLTSLTPPGFVQNSMSEDITTNATFTGELTNLSHSPVGTVTLTGTIEQEVEGRQNQFDTGSWTVDLLSVSLSGTVAGFPLTMTLNTADTSSGTTSIAQTGANFTANSFFDVFVDLTYDGPNGVLTAMPSGTATANGVPEPATLMLLAGPLLVMSALRRRRR